MESVDSCTQTGPDYWLFANLNELALLAPHFLPLGWGVVTYTCNTVEGVSLGFAHNLYHPQLKRFVCDRAIYISQLSYSVGSKPSMTYEAITANRYDGFQITCEQYYVGGPDGKKERYESIVFIQYISELLRIIETLDSKSCTLLLVSEDDASTTPTKDLEKELPEREHEEIPDADNLLTFQKMFSNKMSSKGRSIHLTSKVNEEYGKSVVEEPSVVEPQVSPTSNGDHLETSTETREPDQHRGDTITISDAEGNILAQIKDPSLSLKEMIYVGGKNEGEKEKDNVQVEGTYSSKLEHSDKKLKSEERSHDVKSEVVAEAEAEADDWAKTRMKPPKSPKWKMKKRKKKLTNPRKPNVSKSLNEEERHSLLAEFDFDAKTSLWKCDICQSSFEKPDELKSHLDSHLDLKKFRCELCGTRFTQKHNLCYHMKTVHEGRRNFKCDLCGKAFMKGHDLKRHSNTHEKSRSGFVCKYCNKVYYTQQNYDLHIADHEGNDKGYRWCLICGIKLRYHQHKYHMRKHRGPADCYDCNRTFNNVEILKRHIRLNHSDASDIKCLLCEETCKNKTEMMAHTKASHKTRGAVSVQCQTCLRTFSSSEQLELHSTIHLEEFRPRHNETFKCARCNLEFVAITQFRSHLASSCRGGGGIVEDEFAMTMIAAGEVSSSRRDIVQPQEMVVPMDLGLKEMISGDDVSQLKLATYRVDGPTVFITNETHPPDEGIVEPMETIVNADLKNGFIIQQFPQNQGVENSALTSDNMIWIEDASTENITFTMVSSDS